jgi:hypothetical protein
MILHAEVDQISTSCQKRKSELLKKFYPVFAATNTLGNPALNKEAGYL